VSITLVDVQKFSNYCGMISGYLSRQYQDYQETVIDLKELCCHPDCTFVNDGVIDIDFDQKLIYLTEDSKRIPYDVLSLDIGSATKSLDDVPGAFEFTIPTRPIHDLVSRLERIETDFSKKHQDRQKEVRLVVVGGGASGVELAMSLVGRWRPLLKDRLHITLVTADGSIMSGDNRGGHRTLKEILLKKGIYICFHANVVEVEKNFLKLKSGMKVLFSYCVWATGAGCHDLARTLQHRGLAVTPDGWIDVNESLQSISHPNVFAAGDCCHSSSLALPKAGIYSIQEGPVLARNLRLFNTPRRVAARSLEHFYPDTHGGLQFLDCGDGTGM
jgi:selenide,water dikinase